MGMYDSIIFKCPSCESEIEKQTKAGDCILRAIDSESVPLELAMDVADESVWCQKCKKEWKIIGYNPPKTLSLYLVPPR